MPTQDEQDSALVAELKNWNEGRGISLDNWISCVGNYEHAIGYAALFWPSFAEHDDCVFFSDFSVDVYSGFMAQAKGDKTAVEAVMNHRHILDLFPQVKESPSRSQVVHLGRTLRQMWSSKLDRDFPGRRFEVSFPEGPFDNLLTYEVSFWQVRA